MSGAPSHRILIADDHADIIEALRLLLKNEGYQIEAVKSPAAAVKAVEAHDYSLALIDLNYARDTTSGKEGLDLLSRLQSVDPTLPVVIMTAWANVELAVEAMRRGARDFISKPWENLRLLAIVRNQIELGGAVRGYRRLEQENQLLRGKQAAGRDHDSVGQRRARGGGHAPGGARLHIEAVGEPPPPRHRAQPDRAGRGGGSP